MLALLPALAVLAALLVATGPAVGMVDRGDDDRRFWVNDEHHYKSPWYRGSHRRMINFGCTRARTTTQARGASDSAASTTAWTSR